MGFLWVKNLRAAQLGSLLQSLMRLKTEGGFCGSVSSVVSSSLQPRELKHTRLPCPSLYSGAYSSSCPLSRWCHPPISSSVARFSSCLLSFLASGSFPVSWFFTGGWIRVILKVSLTCQHLSEHPSHSLQWCLQHGDFGQLAFLPSPSRLQRHISPESQVEVTSLLFIYFLATTQHVESSLLTRDWTWWPLHWEPRVLTTESPGKSLHCLLWPSLGSHSVEALPYDQGLPRFRGGRHPSLEEYHCHTMSLQDRKVHWSSHLWENIQVKELTLRQLSPVQIRIAPLGAPRLYL